MEKLNFVKDGVMTLPPGFRFQPTDKEIVFQYLTCKIFSCPLPASIIPEINVCKFDPWDLPSGDSEQDKYFFSKREAKYPNGTRANRATCSGYWKATGVDKRIVCSTRKQIMGMRKTLVFHRGKPPRVSRTDWIMHEYRLVNSPTEACNVQQSKNSPDQKSLIQMGDWVLCRVFLKKRSMINDSEMNQDSISDRNVEVALLPNFYNSMMSSSSSSSSSLSPDSSVITEVSSSGFDHEETSS
ncbi:NAC domain-containing protein 83-like [Cornus florida]|uniref:NAC domain-containing protein 83-like n=1 Tax=Cornus florida TaxID=4283 RepID=UPI00289E8B8D|nr:NAC domain-containing protein 83-like [Cornus florida]